MLNFTYLKISFGKSWIEGGVRYGLLDFLLYRFVSAPILRCIHSLATVGMRRRGLMKFESSGRLGGEVNNIIDGSSKALAAKQFAKHKNSHTKSDRVWDIRPDTSNDLNKTNETHPQIILSYHSFHSFIYIAEQRSGQRHIPHGVHGLLGFMVLGFGFGRS